MELQSLTKQNLVKGTVVLAMLALTLPSILAGTLKIYPTADVYTDSSRSTTVLNNEDLRIGNDVNRGKHRTFFKFDLSSLPADVTSAKLSIDPLGPVGTPTLNLYYMTDDSWSENTLKWSNQPEVSSLVGSQTVSGPNRIEFDVTSYIGEQDNILSFALKSDQENTGNLYVQMFSSEYSGGETYWPYLEITHSGAACNTDADTNCNGCVEMNELLGFIGSWKQGNVQMNPLLNTIGTWKSGSGC